MQRVLRVLVFAVASAAWFAGFAIGGATSAGAESTGCAAFNALPTENLSFIFSDDYDLAAGETIGAVVGQSFAGAEMDVEGTVVSTVANSGGTLSYVVPADGNYNVEFRPEGEDTDADFDFFCIPAPSGPCDGAPTPKGYKVLKGTNGNDVLYAGSGNTIIFGYAGNDWLYGGSGNDILCGGPGKDHLSGGSGADYVDGGDGNDLISGDSGNDKLYGSGGNDWIAGASGDDLLVGGPGTDHLDGGIGGNDTGVDSDPDTTFVNIEHQSQETPG